MNDRHAGFLLLEIVVLVVLALQIGQRDWAASAVVAGFLLIVLNFHNATTRK